MRFLITGASGWIGFALVKRLSKLYGKKKLQLILSKKSAHDKEDKRRKILFKEKYDIILNDLLEDNLNAKKIMPFDVLYHLAAYTEVETKSYKVHVNDIGTEKLLHSLNGLLRGKKVVFTGSILSIDRKYPSNNPLSENSPCNPRTDYGITKLKGEWAIKKCSNLYGFEWVILRLPTVYGPGFRPGGMFAVIPKSLKKNSITTRLPWPGKLSVVYRDDAVKALILLGTKNYKCNEIYHMDSGENPTFDEMITEIARINNIKRRRIKVPYLFWKLVMAVVWLPGLLKVFPFKIRIALWRVSLIVTDGLVFDSSKIQRTMHLKYLPLKKGLPITYKKRL